MNNLIALHNTNYSTHAQNTSCIFCFMRSMNFSTIFMQELCNVPTKKSFGYIPNGSPLINLKV